MKRLGLVLAAVVVALAGLTGTAQAAPLPSGCTTMPPSISFRITVIGVAGVWVTAPPVTCSSSSGYSFTSARIGAQIAVVYPTGALKYRNSISADPTEMLLPHAYFVTWQGAAPGGTPAQGYRGKVTYTLAGPNGSITVSHFTTTVWWS